MDSEDWLAFIGIVGIFLLILFVVAIEIVAVILVAGFLASWFGFTGVMWWAVAIVLFLVINGIIGLLVR